MSSLQQSSGGGGSNNFDRGNGRSEALGDIERPNRNFPCRLSTQLPGMAAHTRLANLMTPMACLQKSARIRAEQLPYTRGKPSAGRHRWRPRLLRRTSRAACCTTLACSAPPRCTSALRCLEQADGAIEQLQLIQHFECTAEAAQLKPRAEAARMNPHRWRGHFWLSNLEKSQTPNLRESTGQKVCSLKVQAASVLTGVEQQQRHTR